MSRSTTEAEYRSIADATAELVWIKALLSDLGLPLSETPKVWSDNTSAVAMSANPVFHAKTKHVDLDLHFVREKVMNGELHVNHIPANAQVADLLTKPLTYSAFSQLREKLNVLSLNDVEPRH